MQTEPQLDDTGRRERCKNQIEPLFPKEVDTASIGRNPPTRKPIQKKPLAKPAAKTGRPLSRVIIRKRLATARERVANAMNRRRTRLPGVPRPARRQHVHVPAMLRQVPGKRPDPLRRRPHIGREPIRNQENAACGGLNGLAHAPN